MGKDSSRQKKTPTTPAGLRQQLERTDRELLQMINLRAQLAHKLETLDKPDVGVEQIPPSADDLLNRVAEHNRGPLSAESVKAVYRELISGIAAIGKTRKVAFLGPAYSYSHVATLHRFGHAIEPIPVGTIPAVFEEVMRNHAHFGVVPIENSTDGRIADTLDMFTRLPVKICGEVQLRIHHCLLAKCPRADIVEIYSRPQALSQCRNWLAKHLPGARTIEVTSTSTAAQLARDKPNSAAIASAQAAAYYGLDVLAPNIEDNAANVTRFAVISHEPSHRTGRDRMSLMFEVEHRPGGLADAINILKKNRLNMTWIESFPIAGSDGRYMFFVELDGHQTDAKNKRAILLLERKCVRLEVLGSYERNAPVD
jgi:chorismate mutase/prephenate dehydratase